MFGVLVAFTYLTKLIFPSLDPEFPALTSEERGMYLFSYDTQPLAKIRSNDKEATINSITVNNTLAIIFLLLANVIQTCYAMRLYWVVTMVRNHD